MGLRFDPVGGGQFKQALKAIIEAESQPIKTLEARKAKEEARLKLFQEFKGKFSGADKAISEISDFKKFREFKVDLGDGANLVNVTVDKDRAEAGSYLIQVDQLAQKTSVISNGFDNPDEPLIGVGYVVMNLASGSKEVFIDENQGSLRGIASAINQTADSPVQASVIKDASDPNRPWRLLLSAKKDGATNQIEFPEFYFLDGYKDFYIDDNHDSQNAKVQIDNFPVELESNQISEFLPGINLSLKQARPDQPFTLSITEDKQKIAGKVKGVIDQLNGVLSFIIKQNQIDEKSDTSTTFAGDSGLQTVEYRLRNLMHEGFAAADPDSDGFRLVFLSDIGIEFDKTGMLSFKEDKFTKALDSDFKGISEAITGEIGFAYQLKSTMQDYTRVGNGFLAMREQGLRSRIKQIDDQIDTKSRLLTQRQQRLTEQFSRLQGTLANLQRQQQYLSAALPSGGGGNLVQQLLGG